MSDKVQKLVDEIGKMTVMEIVDLIKAMEETFGVSAAAATVAVAGPTAAAPAAEEKTEFTVKMTKYPAESKVNVIKVIRAITGLGLKEAKDLVEGAPSVVKEGVNKEEASKIKKELEEAGAGVEVA